MSFLLKFSFRLYSEYMHLVWSLSYGPEDFHNRVVDQLSLLQTCLNTSSTESCAYKSEVCIACCVNVVGYPRFFISTNVGHTVYPKKYAHGFCFAVLCCGYILTDFPVSIRLASLALWQSNDCPSASKATLMNMDKYFMWIHYERLHNHNKAKHNKTLCTFLGIYCSSSYRFENIILCRKLYKELPSPSMVN